jgi:membrane glycosyltransferase
MAGLAIGKSIGWGAQARGIARLPLALVAAKLWPQTLFGLAGLFWLVHQPLDLVWPVIPVAAGPLLAALIAVVTSTKTLGTLAVRSTLWRIPEETTPPTELLDLHLPALRKGALMPSQPQDVSAGQSEPNPAEAG